MTGSNPGQTISQEKYVSVPTFRKTGVAVATATWIVPGCAFTSPRSATAF
jgi:hypothetical protein